MKHKVRMIIGLVFLMMTLFMFAGCQKSENLAQQLDSDNTSTTEEDSSTDNVSEDESDTSLDSDTTQDTDETDKDQEVSQNQDNENQGNESQDNQEEDNENESDSDKGEASDEDTVDVTDSEDQATELEFSGASAVDITEPEDTSNYETNVVFIGQDGDYWRVVDRMGNVYRVTTSYSNVMAGIVGQGEQVTGEGDEKQIELSYDFQYYDGTIFYNGSESSMPEAFADKLLNQYKSISDDSLRINDYKVFDADVVEEIGKGIRVVEINYSVEPSEQDSAWPGVDESGWSQEISYQFVVFTYDDQWVLPTYSELNDSSSVSSQETSTSQNADSASDVSSSDNTATDDVTTTDDATTSDVTNEGSVQETLYSEGDLTFYEERTYIDSDSESSGYTTNIYVQEEGQSPELVAKGGENVQYDVLAQDDTRVYITSSYTNDSGVSETTGIGYLDLSDNTYKILYKGSAMLGTVASDGLYFLTEDQVIKLDRDNGFLETIALLPKSIDFTDDDVSISMEDTSEMDVNISGNIDAEWVINLSTGAVTTN